MSVASCLRNGEKKTSYVERAPSPSGSSTDMVSRFGTWSHSGTPITPPWSSVTRRSKPSASCMSCSGTPDSAQSSGGEHLYTGGERAD